MSMPHFQFQSLDGSKNEIRVLYPIYQPNPASLPKPLVIIQGLEDQLFVTADLSLNFELRTVS
jgi:hypothetical protein